MTATDQDRTTELWVYAGERRGSGGKTVYEWYDIDEDQSRFFKANLVSSAGVGGVYKVVTSVRDGGGITAHGTPEYVRMWDDEDRIQSWHAEHRGWQAARAIERQRAADKKDAPQIFDMTLRELRAKIMSTNYSTAEGIMGAVVAYLGQGIR